RLSGRGDHATRLRARAGGRARRRALQFARAGRAMGRVGRLGLLRRGRPHDRRRGPRLPDAGPGDDVHRARQSPLPRLPPAALRRRPDRRAGTASRRRRAFLRLMARVELEHVDKTFPDGTRAVADATLRIEDGELFVLVGPSGGGKSTVLRLVAGLETATAGTIRIGGRVVNDLRPQDRNVAMVFQDYALYPHMIARRNPEFP